MAWQRSSNQNNGTDSMPERPNIEPIRRAPNQSNGIVILENNPIRMNVQQRMGCRVGEPAEEERYIDDYEVFGSENIVEMIESDEEVDIIDGERRRADVEVLDTSMGANTVIGILKIIEKKTLFLILFMF